MRHSPQALLGKPPVHHKEEFIQGIITFVFEHLAKWRDEPRPTVNNEGLLNGQLCRALNDFAHDRECNFKFHHEADQGANRRVDFSAYEFVFGARAYSLSRYENLTVFEAKRLPAPDAPRMREYVTGEKKKSGGVQRFKAGVHGQTCTVAAMIGYIQQYDAIYFHDKINAWIDELCCHPVDDLTWDSSEKIGQMESYEDGTSRSISFHPRIGNKELMLHHLCVNINPRFPHAQKI